MKRKFLLFVFAVLCILQANAYTTSDMESAGWTLANSLSDNASNVYVFVDAGSRGFAISGITTIVEWRKNDGPIPTYQTLASPFTAPYEVWTIESRNDGYALRNIVSQDYFNSNHGGLGDGWRDYMDSDYATGSFTFESISDGKYHLKGVSSNSYVGPWNNNLEVSDGVAIAANKNPNASVGDDPGPTLGFYIYKMAKATYALKYLQNCPNLTAPVDVSFLIENPTIYQANNDNQMPNGWDKYDDNTDVFTSAGAGSNTRLKIYDAGGTLGFGANGKGDYFATIGNLPNGQYRVTAGIRGNGGDASKFKVYIYQSSTDTRAESSSAPNGDMADRTTDYMTINSGTANIGVHTTSTVGSTTLEADNFRMEVNPYLSTMATELSFPGSTSLTAGVWYYYDIPATNTYDFTSSAAATIYYTQAADPLLDASTTPEAFTTGQTKAISLSAGRVYFKASEATTFSVAYRYNVGSATLSNADGSYTQNSTFSVTFPDAATNDPSASPALVASSKATVNGNEVALSAVTNGFSLNLGSLTANTDYVIAIPANVYGYNGESMNGAINVTLHTPTVFDGEYVLYDAATEMFLGRGSGYGTEAVLDKYGVPFNLETDATGTSSIEFVDWTGVYLYITGTSVYTDKASTGWTLNPVVGGYTLSNVAKTAYATHATGSFGEYVRTTDNSASATVWTLMSKSERDAIIAAYPAENKSNIIAASGISTTAGDFETFLSNNYNAVDCTSAIGTATFTDGSGDWTWTGSWREQDGQPKYGTNFVEAWNATGAWTQTVGKANLPAGIYKVTVQGFERRKANDAATALYAAGYNLVSTFLSANGEQVRFTDWNEVDGKPTDTSGAVTAFGSGEAVNTVYVYLDGNTDLNLTVRKPNYIWDCWIIMNNFTLTRYEQTEVTMKTFKAGSYGTFIAPFDVTIPSGVTASKVTGHVGNLLTLEDLTTTIPKNTPVVVYSEDAINQTFKGKDGSNGVTSYSEGLLTGIYTAASIAEGNYVLQTNGGVQGFYQVGAGGLTGVPYRAYLTVPAEVKAAAFFFEGDADAISDVRSKKEDGRSEIFNLAGQRMNRLQRGVNIVNGKKVLVK